MKDIYTAFCQEANGKGTIWIDQVVASCAEEAATEAQAKCAADWDYDPTDVHVLGIAQGKVDILQWDDLNE